MKSSKIIYLFNIILFLILIFSFKNYQYKSKYDDELEVTGIVTKITLKDGNIKIILKAKEKLLLTCYDCNFEYKVGDIVKFRGYFKEIEGSSNFNLFDYKKYLKSLKIYKNFIFEDYSYIRSSNNIIYKTYNILNSKISKLKSGYFLKGIILGDTSEFDSFNYESYKQNGIVHLFAVSGMHVGLVSSLLMFILKKVLRLDKIAYLFIYAILIFYMLIINSPSIIRSVIMFIAISLTRFFKIKISNINILYYLFVINLILNKYLIYNTGFLLSYTIVFFLIVSNKKINKINNYFLKLFYLSLISFLASFPILINSNFEFNLLTPIINMFMIPLVSIILFPISLITIFLPILDNILVYILNGFNALNIFFSKSGIMISVSYLNIYLIIIYYLFLILILFKRKYIFIFLLYFFLLINLKNINFNSYLIMIDVGQGDSILIKNYFGENILIDAGSKKSSAPNIIIPYLKSLGISKLDRFIITHGDADHIIGALDVLKAFKVQEVYLNSYKNSTYEEEIIKKYNVNLISHSNYLSEHIYLINNHSKDENDDSLVTYLIDYKVLLMGDASSEVESKIDIHDINILKVGHHGSKTSSSKEFIDKIKPKISLISVGLNNKYGHPNKEVLENLKNSLILKTSVNGMIKVNLKTLKYQTMF